MDRKSLICKRSTRSWTGKTLELEYYLLCESVLGGCAESYGVEIVAKYGDQVEYAGVPRITMTGTRILRLIDTLAAGTVTPTTLPDVIQDWL